MPKNETTIVPRKSTILKAASGQPISLLPTRPFPGRCPVMGKQDFAPVAEQVARHLEEELRRANAASGGLRRGEREWRDQQRELRIMLECYQSQGKEKRELVRAEGWRRSWGSTARRSRGPGRGWRRAACWWRWGGGGGGGSSAVAESARDRCGSAC